jgi:hypothetical protein
MQEAVQSSALLAAPREERSVGGEVMNAYIHLLHVYISNTKRGSKINVVSH